MKAAVLYEHDQPLQIKDLQQDPPKVGEVRVKMAVSGICASDYHVAKGHLALARPMVLGHEAAGTIAEVGDGVTRVKPGDRCVISFVSHCGDCRMCLTGSPQLCETNFKTYPTHFDGTVRLHDGDADVYQMTKLGSFAEYTVVHQQACHLLPDEVPSPVAALIGCSVTTGVGAVINNPFAHAGMSVAVFGCGGVGLNVIQGARLLNASRIIAVDIFDHKLEFTYKFGATDVINAQEVDPAEVIKEMTDGGVDMAFDSFGSPVAIGNAFRSLRRGGTAVQIGLAKEGDNPPIDMVDMVRGQKSLMGSYYGSASPHETFDKLLDFYLKGRIDVEGLITRHYAFEQVNEGLAAFDKGEDGRGVIVFDS